MPESGFDFMSLMPLILIFVVFYFLLIRPQQKQMKEKKQMLSSLSRGDHVITNGGVMGKITKVSEGELSLEIAKGVEVQVVRSMVNSLTSKTAPVSDDAPKDKKAPAKKPVASKKKPSKKKPAAKTISKK